MGLQQQQLAFQSARIPHYYLCNYLPQSAGADTLSKSLLRFKQGIELDVKAWTSCSLSVVSQLKLTSNTLVLRALQSDEVVVQNRHRPLDTFCISIAEGINGFYKPTFIGKSRATRPLKYLPLVERQKEMEDVYYFTLPKDEMVAEILLIDDILTSGATICAIVEAIRAVVPTCPISVFTLAASDRQAYLNLHLKLSSSTYSWESTLGWQMVGEEIPPYTLAHLEDMIMQDSFR